MANYQRWYLFMNSNAQMDWENTNLSEIYRFVANMEPRLSLQELQEMIIEHNRVTFNTGQDLYHIILIPAKLSLMRSSLTGSA